MLKFVQEVQPKQSEQFSERAPPQVADAMRQTVTNMLGTLPAEFFDVTVTTVGENLAQLMYSVMMTGYMFKNAQTRLELKSLSATAASAGGSGSGGGSRSLPTDAEGVQKRGIEGEVLRWSDEEGVRRTGAMEYIDELEGQVRLLREELAAQQRAGRDRNSLLEYLKSLEPANLQALSASAGEEVLEAMNSFIQRLVGADGAGGPTEGEGFAGTAYLRTASTETTAQELARLLLWLLVVGYSLRTIELRLDMESSVGGGAAALLKGPSASDLMELPP